MARNAAGWSSSKRCPEETAAAQSDPCIAEGQAWKVWIHESKRILPQARWIPLPVSNLTGSSGGDNRSTIRDWGE